MGRKRPWKEEYLTTIYELAKAGESELNIAKVVGVTAPTFRAWKKKRPAIANAIKRGRGIGTKMKTASEFLHYVYGRMHPEAQAVFDKLSAFEHDPNGIKKVEALFEKQGKHVRQHIYLHALVAKNFNPSRACAFVGIHRSELYRWSANDPEFVQILDEINLAQGDLYESSLIALVLAGDSAATIFANKTFNAKRGYSEKVGIEIEGQVNHHHALIAVDELGLSIDTRKEILERIRDRDSIIEGKVLESKS